MIQTLRMRLTLWIAFGFGCLALVVFLTAYYMVQYQLLHEADIDLQDTVQEFAERLKTGGMKALKVEIDSETASHGEDVFFARFVDQQGEIQAEELPRTWAFAIPKVDQSKHGLQWFDIDTDLDGGPVRLVAMAIPNHGWLEIGMSLADYELQMDKMGAVFAFSLLIMALLGILAGWLQLRTVFYNVEQVRSTAVGISEGNLSSRVELRGQGKELSDLTFAFNTMLDRIQLLMREMRDVSDHVAHDLRTPVSRMRGVAETCLTMHHKSLESQARKQAEVLGIVVDEAGKLGEMINTMLEITQTDAGLIHYQQSHINLAEVLREAHDLFQSVAEDAGIVFSMDLPVGDLLVTGNRTRLQRVVSNLIDNALKFSSAGGHVNLSAGIDQDTLFVRIRDHGTGISPTDMEYIFDRFYRADQSRNKPGNGLGLSYAASIIHSHGGDIQVKSAIGEGSTFIVLLPLHKT